MDRAAKAEADRMVSIRPAPDTMTYVTALLPVAQGVGVYAALKRAAETTVDDRSRGQVMADTLVERITGRPAETPESVAVNLVLTDATLLGGDTTPAVIDGYGPIPAAVARGLIDAAVTDERSRATLRRLYRHPSTGALVAMESRSRCFPRGLGRLHRAARSTLSHALLRCPDPASRPRPTPQPRRADQRESTVWGRVNAATTPRKPPAGRSAPVTTAACTPPNSSTPTGERYHSTAPPLPGPEVAGQRS